MTDDFSKSVENGFKLSKRIYYGKDRSLSAPKMETIEKSLPETYLPTAPMVYAVIAEPSVVDNPDVPSYQPYVYGRCDPPAFIPLHMHGIAMEVDCYLDTAFVTVSGTWRVHCVTGSAKCDCRIAVPMGEQGSILGVEVDSIRKSCCTQLFTIDDANNAQVVKPKDGCLLKWKIYTLKVPQVDGGTNISMKVSWSQKLLYEDGQFCLNVPFSFPMHVVPVGKKISKREKICLNINSGMVAEILCGSTSHPLKQMQHQVGKLCFSYEAEVMRWSTNDLKFSYSVSFNDISGGLLLHSPSLYDVDQREMFCLYLFPGNRNVDKKVFRKEVVYVIDVSASMRGRPLESAKDALLAALSELRPIDSFNIIAFNGDTSLFSSSMELATKEAISNAAQWISTNFIAEGRTNISLPLNQALVMLSKTGDSIPLIFLVTDGSVEDEREICNIMKHHVRKGGLNCPRVCTFGIGSYCNHYFLQMLAQIGRGYYDAACDLESINFRMRRLFNNVSSVILANITVDALERLDSVELYPISFPDLLSGSPLIVSGRYHGNLPESVKATGTLADLSNFVIDVKVQKPKDFPLDRVFARREIDALTSNAWLLENKQLEEKVAKLSMQTGVPSEYSCMTLVLKDNGKHAHDSVQAQEKMARVNGMNIIFLRSVCFGFGNLIATYENLAPGTEEPIHESKDMIMKAASRCCSSVLDRCCCMCFIQFCSKLNDQCAIAFTQLCTGLACFQCFDCCANVCCSCD